MSINPQWNAFQPPQRSDNAILEFKLSSLALQLPNRTSSLDFNTGNNFNLATRQQQNASNNFGKSFINNINGRNTSNYQSNPLLNYLNVNSSPTPLLSIRNFSNPNFLKNFNSMLKENSRQSASAIINNNLNQNLNSQKNYHKPISCSTSAICQNPPDDIFTNAGTFNISDLNDNVNSSSHQSNNNSLTSNNQGVRETGIIEKLLPTYGFIQCCDRQARLFFHFSQFQGNIEHLKIGDPVEFEMTYDRRTGKPIASSVSKISSEFVAQQAFSEERVLGVVSTEIRNEGTPQEVLGRISYENCGECFFLPYGKNDIEGNVVLKAGDKVSFQIYAEEKTGNLAARHIRLEDKPIRYRGIISATKEGFGLIERGDVVREIQFSFSEAQEPVQPGDDVEFTIQTRCGKEMAIDIIKLPPGTVIFEDVNLEVIRGQVLKPTENNCNKSAEPLSGRIRYRGKDRSEMEITFGEKDQRRNFTLRHGDWVQFNIATDRRDEMQRATCISLLDESFLVSGEKREQGIVESLLEDYGMLKCVERENSIFFYICEWLDLDEEIKIGKEVEFTVVQDLDILNFHKAIRIKPLPQKSVQFEIVIKFNILGEISREPPCQWSQRTRKVQNLSLNGPSDKIMAESGVITYEENGIPHNIIFYLKDCDLRTPPKLRDKVEFNISQVKRTKELIATDVRVPNRTETLQKSDILKCQGNIVVLKDGYGFIEAITHDHEVFFHFSNFEGDISKLHVGQEVEYCISKNNHNPCKMSVDHVAILPQGSLGSPEVNPEHYNGIIIRPLRAQNPEQSEYCGLVQMNNNGEVGPQFQFGITSLENKNEILQKGDAVTFQVEKNSNRATNIQSVKKKLKSTVEAIKGPFGFLSYEVEAGKKLFFHMSEVKNGCQLYHGDHVEFALVHNSRSGKYAACNVVKLSEDQRPERLISKLRSQSTGEIGSKLTILRQPKGPDGTQGFKEARDLVLLPN